MQSSDIVILVLIGLVLIAAAGRPEQDGSGEDEGCRPADQRWRLLRLARLPLPHAVFVFTFWVRLAPLWAT